jgi:hypothetical protein
MESISFGLMQAVIVDPGRTLVVFTPDEQALVLLPGGSWTRTPLKDPHDLAAKVENLAYKKLIIDHIEVRRNLAKAKQDLAAADLKYELDLVAPPETIWRRKGGENC